MGHALCRRRVHAMAALLVAVVSAGALAVGPAGAEAPPEDLLVTPPGLKLLTSTGPVDTDLHGNFLAFYPGLDYMVVDGAMGAVRRDDYLGAMMITVVRLANKRQAAEALAAFGGPIATDVADLDAVVAQGLADQSIELRPVEVLPQPSPDSMARRLTVSEGAQLVEFARATGRDLVVFAQLGDTSGEVLPVMHETLDAHRAAFPDMTMPAAARAGPSWVLVGGVAAVVLAVLGLVVALPGRRRLTRILSRPSTVLVPPAHGGGPSRARANW